MVPHELNGTLLAMQIAREERTASTHAAATAAREATEAGGSSEAIRIFQEIDEPLYEATSMSGAPVALS